MKYVLVCAVLLTTSQCLAQAPKKTNLIIVKGPTIREAVAQLVSSGYILDKIDTTFGIVTTQPKSPKKTTASMVLQLVQKDSLLYISGMANSNMKVNTGLFIADSPTQPVSNSGMKGSDMRLCFAEMDRLARSFDKEVVYKTN